MTSSDEDTNDVLRQKLAKAGWVVEPRAGISNPGPLLAAITEATRAMGYSVEGPAEPEALDSWERAEVLLANPYTLVFKRDQFGSGLFRGQILEFPGCTAQGADLHKCNQNLLDAGRNWLVAAIDGKQPIPDPLENVDQLVRAGASEREAPPTHESEHDRLVRLIWREGVAPAPHLPMGHQIQWWIRAMRRAVDAKAPALILPSLLSTLHHYRTDPRCQLIYDTLLPIPAERYDQQRLTALTHAVNLAFFDDWPMPLEGVMTALKDVRKFRLSAEPPPRTPRLENVLFWLEAMRQSIPFSAQDEISAPLIHALSAPVNAGHKLLYDTVLFTPASALIEPKIRALERATRLVLREDAAPAEAVADILRSSGLLGSMTP